MAPGPAFRSGVQRLFLLLAYIFGIFTKFSEYQCIFRICFIQAIISCERLLYCCAMIFCCPLSPFHHQTCPHFSNSKKIPNPILILQNTIVRKSVPPNHKPYSSLAVAPYPLPSETTNESW